LCEYGAGIRERILPVTRFAVPFDEFSRALELSPATRPNLATLSDSED